MKPTSGYSLIELLIVIAIIAILSLVGSVNVIAFQKSSLLEATAREFVSTLKENRSKSIFGASLAPHDITYFDPNFLPRFQVNSLGNQYQVQATYRVAGDVTDSLATIQTIDLPQGITLSPASTVTFARITGQASGNSIFSLTRTGSSDSKQITISAHDISLTNL